MKSTLLKYIKPGGEDYCYLKSPALGSGFNDYVYQLQAYLYIARELKLPLILSKGKLSEIHNNGKIIRTDLSDYCDFSQLNVLLADECITGSAAEILYLNREDISKIRANRNYNDTVIPFTSDIILTAKKIADNIIDGVVHIRRGDRVKVGALNVTPKQWDLATREDNIINMLDTTNAPANIYIMTDMPKDDQIISELKKSKKYNFKFYFDFAELVSIKVEDNYKLYCIEQQIAKKLPYFKRISHLLDNLTA